MAQEGQHSGLSNGHIASVPGLSHNVFLSFLPNDGHRWEQTGRMRRQSPKGDEESDINQLTGPQNRPVNGQASPAGFMSILHR